MDSTRFDNMTRLFGAGTSRRKVLRGLVGGAGALAVAGTSHRLTSAAPDCRTFGEICQLNPGEGNNCCEGLECSDPGAGHGICGCPSGTEYCAPAGACLDPSTQCCIDDDCGACQECEGYQCVDLNDCCTDDEACGPCESCENNTCVPYARYCESTQQCYSPSTGGCCPNTADGCGDCYECVNSTCTHIDDCCIDNSDCQKCSACESGECVPYAEYCPETDECYNTSEGECCTDDDCGDEACAGGHCCPPGYKFCPNGQYCYTDRQGECCTDDDCPACNTCGENNQCTETNCCDTDNDCDSDEICCNGYCVDEHDPCCQQFGETCGVLNVAGAGGDDRQYDCCDGLLCCFGQSTNVCGECCADSDCTAYSGGVCNDFICEYPTCQQFGETCGVLDVASAGGDDRQYDCCDGLLCCFGQSTNVCGECCADSDCTAYSGGLCNDFICAYPTCQSKGETCAYDADCCGSLLCLNGCCEHPHKPHPKPAPAPDEPVTTLPATGGKSGKSDSSAALGITLAAGAAALLGAKVLRQNAPEAGEDA